MLLDINCSIFFYQAEHNLLEMKALSYFISRKPRINTGNSEGHNEHSWVQILKILKYLYLNFDIEHTFVKT